MGDHGHGGGGHSHESGGGVDLLGLIKTVDAMAGHDGIGGVAEIPKEIIEDLQAIVEPGSKGKAKKAAGGHGHH